MKLITHLHLAPTFGVHRENLLLYLFRFFFPGPAGLKTTNETTYETEVHRRKRTEHRQVKDIKILDFDILRAVIIEVLRLFSKLRGLG